MAWVASLLADGNDLVVGGIVDLDKSVEFVSIISKLVCSGELKLTGDCPDRI